MSKKSKSTTGPSKFAQPYIKKGADVLGNEFDSSIGNIRQLSGDISGGLYDFASGRLAEGDPGVNAARDYGVDVLAGNYLTQNNPYFQDMLGNALNESTNATQAALGLRGLTGGSDYAGIIADRNAKTATGLAYNDYGRERAAMDAAAGRAGQIASADYLPVQGLMASLAASQAPLNAASQYAGGIGGLLGNAQTTTSQRSPWEMLASAAGNAASAFAASERRVKRDIVQIGTLPDGLGVYNFRYLWDGDDESLRTGVMVDEVEKLRPWALGPVVDGIQTVDYSRLETA